MRTRNSIVLWKGAPAGSALRRRAQGAIRFTRTKGLQYRWRLEGRGVVPAVLSLLILIPALLIALVLGLILFALLALVALVIASFLLLGYLLLLLLGGRRIGRTG